MPKHILRFAAPACLGLSLAAVPGIAAAEPAPPGLSSATGLQVGELLGVSETGAEAGPAGAGSEASVVSVFGDPLLGLGGGNDASGALLEANQSGGPTVQVAPWEASADNTAGDSRSSAARAAVARAAVPSVAEAHVVESESQASHTDPRSSAAAVSNGVRVGLFDLVRLTLLHSEVSSSGQGSSHLVGLNDTEIGSDEQFSDVCSLSLDPIASVLCLTASGGAGADEAASGAAGVADADSSLLGALGDSLFGVTPASAFATTGGGATGSVPVLAAPDTATGGTTGSAAVVETARSGADDSGIGAALARTGATAMDLLPWGIGVLGLGAGLQVLCARRRALI